MKRKIITTIIFFNACLAFGQTGNIFLYQKVKIISEIIARLSEEKPGSAKGFKIILTGIIGTKYRKVTYEEGTAYNGLLLSDYKTDSLLLDTIKKKFPNGLFYDDGNVIFLRGDIIKSTYMVSRDSCKTCESIFFEIKEPLEGWQNVGIASYFNSRYADSAAIYKYYGNKLSIPVFVCSIIGDNTKINNYIFVFDILSDKDKIHFVKKIDLMSN